MCFGSRPRDDEAGAARSRELDKMIRADEKRMTREVKLLLLGMLPPAAASLPLRLPSLACHDPLGRLLTGDHGNRCGRVGQVDGAEADEIDLFARIQQDREA